MIRLDAVVTDENGQEYGVIKGAWITY
jgi:hypothetical protein